MPYTREDVAPLTPATAVPVVAGLLLGSFLNVCIVRLPRHASIAWPGSHCPRCGAPIRPFDNVPVLSYGVLRGRCRDCRKPISPRYPLVEAALAGLFVLCAGVFPLLPYALEACALCFLLLGLLVMDAETLLLPDAFTLPGAALGFLQAGLPRGGLIAGLHLAAHAPLPLPQWPPLASSLLGAAAGAGFLLLIRVVYKAVRGREGMGLGDIKLAALLGAWLGLAGVALTLGLAILLGALAGLALLLFVRRDAGSLRLPFGSFLCAGGLLTLFCGRPLLTWYFHFWV